MKRLTIALIGAAMLLTGCPPPGNHEYQYLDGACVMDDFGKTYKVTLGPMDAYYLDEVCGNVYCTGGGPVTCDF